MKRILQLATTLLVSASFHANATIIPFGLQTDVSQATVDTWGWTECHRSGGSQLVSTQSIINTCSGEYVAMGVWDRTQYGVIGIGEFTAVTRATHQNHSDDNQDASLNNWSNGLNWYRTSGSGSWGFTTLGETALNSADVMLVNGVRNFHGATTETADNLAKGLSFHVNGNGDLSSGWAYNATGNNLRGIGHAQQRVFWTATAVPEPATWLMICGALGLLSLRRYKQS